MYRLKTLFSSLSLIFLLVTPFLVLAEESITITTYYPSPYGSYNELYVASKLGIGTTGPVSKLHVVAPGGFVDDTHNSGQNVPIMAEMTADSTFFGVYNKQQHQALAWNIIGSSDSTHRGVPTLHDKYDGSWHAGISQMNGNVGIGTTEPGAKLDVAGGIKSTMWKVTQLFNMQGSALPLTSASFNTGGGTLLIFASGSGYGGTPQQIGMSIAVDGVVRGYTKAYTNEVSSHKAFTTNPLVVTGIAAGSHTITLASWNSTLTDVNDFFSVTVLELPF